MGITALQAGKKTFGNFKRNECVREFGEHL